MIRISYNVQRYYISTIYTKFMIKKARKADFILFLYYQKQVALSKRVL